MARKLFIGLLVAAILPQSAAAQQSGTDKAYTLALMCYSVAARFYDNTGAKIASQAIDKLGAQKGLTSSQIAKDTITMASVMGDRERNDPGILDRYRVNCRQLGMAS